MYFNCILIVFYFHGWGRSITNRAQNTNPRSRNEPLYLFFIMNCFLSWIFIMMIPCLLFHGCYSSCCNYYIFFPYLHFINIVHLTIYCLLILSFIPLLFQNFIVYYNFVTIPHLPSINLWCGWHNQNLDVDHSILYANSLLMLLFTVGLLITLPKTTYYKYI